MIHPVFKLLLARPELLGRHLGAYLALAEAEAAQALAAWRWRLMVALAGAVLGVAAVGLGGVAALLAAALPLASMPLPWLLWALPGGLLLAALACAAVLVRQPSVAVFDSLREQSAADLALLQEAGARVP